ATVGDIVDTINNVFHTVHTTKTNEQITSAADNTGVAVKAGDTLNFVAAKNLEITQDKHTITYGLSSNIEVNSATIGKAGKVDKNGNPVVQSSNGNYYPAGTQLDENGNPVDPSVQPIAPNSVKNDTAVALTSDKGVSTTDTTLKPRDPNDPSTNITVNNPPTALSVKDVNGDNSQINGIASALGTKEVTTNNPANATNPTDKDTLVDLTEPTNPADKAKWESSAVTVGDIAKMGWVVSAEGNNYTDTVKNANEVKFIGKNGITVTGETKNGVREITVAMEEGEVIKPNEGTVDGNPVVIVNGKVYNRDDIDPTTGLPRDGNVTPRQDANGKDLTPDQVVNNGSKFVTGNKVAQAIQESGFTVGKETDTSGITFNNTDEKVNPNDELRFADGKGTIVSTGTVKQTDEKGEVVTKTVVKVDVDTAKVEADTDGSIKDPMKAAKDAVKQAQDALAANPTDPDLQQALEAAQAEEAKAGNRLATANDVANAINNSGWNTNSTTATGGATNTLIKPSKSVNFEAGQNMEIKQDVKDGNVTYTYATKDDVEFNSVKIGKPGKVDSNGNPVVQGQDGNYYPAGTLLDENGNPTDPNVAPIDSANVKDAPVVNMTPTETAVANGDITPAVNVNGATFTNMAANLPDTTSSTNAPTKQAPISAEEAANVANKSGSNAATLGDVLNAGWNLQENGSTKDFVKPYDTVNFVNGTGTVANVTSDGSVSNVTYHIAVDDKTTEITYTNSAGDTLYKQADGTYNTQRDGSGTTVNAGNVTGSRVSAKTAPLTNNVDGSVNTPENPTALATAGDVANAINNSGFTLTTTASKGEVSGSSNYSVNLGKTVTIDAGKNIQITQNNGVISVATKDDVEFNSVNVGPVSINNTTGIDAGNTKITNVARGTNPNDAVNVSQLKEAAGDINNKIDRNTKDLRAGLAGARAAAGLPQVYLPGKSMVAVSAGAYKDQSAIAVGYSRASDNGKLILKLQGDTNSRGEVGGSVGVGYQW
ncbi:YadA-like family protein, partial [Rodentibacter rarus]|uniref:YadA-like family protein n=1 Tax=Rodentibacter rarus TaxID=1908260 RepID=UPI001ABFD4FB